MNFEFGKTKRKPKSKPKSKSKSSKKLHKKMLDSMSLSKLQKLSKKYKVSCFKKGTKVHVKKSTLLNRLKKNRSINKILESASRMKKAKRTSKSKFGSDTYVLKSNVPNFSTPLELSLGQTYDYQKRHYKSIPKTLISYNLQGTGATNAKTKMQIASKNFKYTRGSLGPSLGPYENINDPKHPLNKNTRFGQYFR